MSLEGRVALITGGSRGLGRVMAIAFAQAGADVIVAARSETQPRPELPGTIYETAEAVKALGRKALPVKCDITNSDDVDALVAKSLEEFGKVDILVHGAAVRMVGNLAEMPMRRVDAMMQANLRTTIQLVKGVLPKMQEQRWGHIIAVAPRADRMPASGPGLVFGLTKQAQGSFILGVAEELAAHNIAANTMWPGGNRDTAGNRMFRAFDPETHTLPELFADAALAIVSKDPSVRTGKAYTDDEVLREEGTTDFSKYRIPAEHQAR